MYFVKDFYGGGAEYDPRRKHWAEYKCAVCGHEHHFDITKKSMDFEKEEKCPKCGKYNPDDWEGSVRAEIEKLTCDRNRIQVRIDELIKSLEEKKPETQNLTWN